MSHGGIVVAPLSKLAILNQAAKLRSCFKQLITPQGRLQIDSVYEVLPDLLPGFRFEVVDRHVLNDDHGRTYSNDMLIQLRRDVYDGMCCGEGRDRFTGAHELGHLFLHQSIPMARAMRHTREMPAYTDSEWQANTFASGLLIDPELLKLCRSVEEVANRFGVSTDAAKVRFQK